MAIPALHISLGTFLKFFVLLENNCYQLDLKIAAMTGDGSGLNEEQVKLMTSSFKEIKKIEEEIINDEETITLVHTAIAENIAQDPENEATIKQVYEPRLVHLAKKVKDKVLELDKQIFMQYIH